MTELSSELRAIKKMLRNKLRYWENGGQATMRASSGIVKLCERVGEHCASVAVYTGHHSECCRRTCVARHYRHCAAMLDRAVRDLAEEFAELCRVRSTLMVLMETGVRGKCLSSAKEISIRLTHMSWLCELIRSGEYACKVGAIQKK